MLKTDLSTVDLQNIKLINNTHQDHAKLILQTDKGQNIYINIDLHTVIRLLSALGEKE